MVFSIEDSLRQFDQVLRYFSKYTGQAVLIEMSDLPMSEWKIVIGLNQNERLMYRHELAMNKKSFAAFEIDEDRNSFNFFFADKFFLKRIDLKTSETLCFRDFSIDEELGVAAGRELKLLKKQLLTG